MSEPSNRESTSYTITFMVILSFICALILSVLASVLSEPKEIARDLDRSTQMMIAAKIYNPEGYFQLLDDKGNYVPAIEIKDGVLVPDEKKQKPSRDQLIAVYKSRFKSFLIDDKSDLVSFEKAKIDENEYVAKYKKMGYYTQPYKLIYEILPNPSNEKSKENVQPEGYVIPVNGYGLWDAIYGYLAIKPDGDSIIGISWYDQKETPGLGANISETPWQSLFPGKKIFQPGANGKTDYKSAPVGIVVVRGKVDEVLGASPKAASAVDGMAGATLTGNGVTKAYQDVLTAYRPFLMKLVAENEQKPQSKG